MDLGILGFGRHFVFLFETLVWGSGREREIKGSSAPGRNISASFSRRARDGSIKQSVAHVYRCATGS
jgi:hypothetical protein